MSLKYKLNNMNLKKYLTKFRYLQKVLGDVNTIVEIGAHYGEDTLRFYHFFPNANIYCFEPDPRNISIIKETITDIKDRIKLYPFAISDKAGTMDFYQAYSELNGKLQEKYKYIGDDKYKKLKLNGSGASSLKKSNIYLKDSNVIKVDTIRLDDWFNTNKIKHIDFLWIDVQGAEKEVIKGCNTILNKIKFIQIEYGETSYEGGLSKKETLDMMIDKGFELILDYNPNNLSGDFLFKNKKLN